jgi:hypothetical protein
VHGAQYTIVFDGDYHSSVLAIDVRPKQAVEIAADAIGKFPRDFHANFHARINARCMLFDVGRTTRRRQPALTLCRHASALSHFTTRNYMLSNLFSAHSEKLHNLLRKGATCGLAATMLLGAQAQSAQAASGNLIFSMVPSATAASCLPKAQGRVTVASAGGSAENMHVEVAGLPANTAFDFFLTQVPNAPFGLAWYQGDIQTDAHGIGVGDFAGRFQVETLYRRSGRRSGAGRLQQPALPRCEHESEDGPGAHVPSRTLVWLPGERRESRLPKRDHSVQRNA